MVFVPTTGELFTATRGGGARLNGAPIGCSTTTDLSLALVATGFSYQPERRARQAARVAQLIPQVRDIRRFGAAAPDLCYVAAGRFDVYFEEHLGPWDMAAGELIAREAGCRTVPFTAVLRTPRRCSWPTPRCSIRHDSSSSMPTRRSGTDFVWHHVGVGTRILSVEDDERIRTAVKLALEDEGWTVDEAGSGEEAIELFQRATPDVVLIDIMLPGIDGFELCRTLRRTSDVPIVMVTARNDTHDVVAGLEAGADDYLTKPFAPKELSARIRALLRRIRPISPGHTKLVFGDLEIVPDEGKVHPQRHRAAPHQDRVPSAVRTGAEPRAGVQPREPARQGLGLRLLRRRSTGRRARAPPAHQGRDGSGQPASRRDGARARLPPAVLTLPDPFT